MSQAVRAYRAGGRTTTTRWARRRVQLIGGLAIGLGTAALVGLLVDSHVAGYGLFRVSLAGIATAIIASSYFFYNLSVFPGTRSDYHILPVYTASFGALFAAFLFARFDYSRPMLATGYLAAMGWHYFICFKVQRRQRLTFAVVPFGQVDVLYGIEPFTWRTLAEPVMPRDCRALVADFGSDLPPDWEQFLANSALRGISVIHYKQLRQSITGQVEIEHLSENANGTLIPNASFLVIKLLIDVFVGAVALLALAPVLLLIALLVRLDSAGPALFSQQRMGYRGRPFRVWKFRTMAHDTPAPRDAHDARLESAKTGDGDARITKLGRVLRHYRLDELPQMFNIVRGEMSWIGPRPEVVVLSRWYQAEIPFYRYRHIVRPGISGWAQVNQGHVAELGDISHKLNYDFYYISHFSPWLDVLIIVRTIKTMLTGFGAR